MVFASQASRLNQPGWATRNGRLRRLLDWPATFRSPQGDVARQAVAALRGYAFQLYGSVLAWLELKDGEDLFLEVAEDYAVVAQDALKAVQAKETRASGTVTLNTEGVREAINSFVDLSSSESRANSLASIFYDIAYWFGEGTCRSRRRNIRPRVLGIGSPRSRCCALASETVEHWS